MKRFLIIYIVFALIISTIPAYADIDLSGVSYDELIALKDQIYAAIWNSGEWKEAIVPAGVYVVGENIPAGQYTIEMADAESMYPVCTVATYGCPDDFYNSHGCVTNTFLNEGVTYTMRIVDGQLINVNGNSIIIRPFVGDTILFK